MMASRKNMKAFRQNMELPLIDLLRLSTNSSIESWKMSVLTIHNIAKETTYPSARTP